jgi:hypothetical protein
MAGSKASDGIRWNKITGSSKHPYTKAVNTEQSSFTKVLNRRHSRIFWYVHIIPSYKHVQVLIKHNAPAYVHARKMA